MHLPASRNPASLLELSLLLCSNQTNGCHDIIDNVHAFWRNIEGGRTSFRKQSTMRLVEYCENRFCFVVSYSCAKWVRICQTYVRKIVYCGVTDLGVSTLSFPFIKPASIALKTLELSSPGSNYLASSPKIQNCSRAKHPCFVWLYQPLSNVYIR